MLALGLTYVTKFNSIVTNSQEGLTKNFDKRSPNLRLEVFCPVHLANLGMIEKKMPDVVVMTTSGMDRNRL